MKIININESQKKRLFEAYDGKFSFDELDKQGDLSSMYNYCINHLGAPFAKGSSRIVFMLSDNFVLKLAYDYVSAGIEQNKVEFERYENSKSKLLPIIYDHSDNFEYLVCENVVPATYVDFEKILGVPYGSAWVQNTKKTQNVWSKSKGDKEVGYDIYFDNLKKHNEKWVLPSISECIFYLEDRLVYKTAPYDEELSDVINIIPWLSELRKLIYEEQISDLDSINNFGIVNRNGTPSIVIIDAGFNKEIYNKFYR